MVLHDGIIGELNKYGGNGMSMMLRELFQRSLYGIVSAFPNIEGGCDS